MSGDLAGLQNGSDLQFIEMQSRYQAQASLHWCAAAIPGIVRYWLLEPRGVVLVT